MTDPSVRIWPHQFERGSGPPAARLSWKTSADGKLVPSEVLDGDPMQAVGASRPEDVLQSRAADALCVIAQLCSARRWGGVQWPDGL